VAAAEQRPTPPAAIADAGLAFCNQQRTGYTPRALTPPYRRVWVHQAAQPPRPAWREPVWEPQRIDFDYAPNDPP
jgi:hypothetical protein